ncbi:MAG: hypothetical protein ACREKL_09730 [Chthoniobacterales bacterium]
MADIFSRPTSRRRPSRRGFNDREEKPRSEGGLFGWTIFILLLVALAAVCWMGTLYIFGHPETPTGYSVLSKFKKLEAPKRFNEIGAPKGEFLDAGKLYNRYMAMSPRALRNESDRLLRAYIRNYVNPGGLIPYITGKFNILNSYELTKNDFFQSGVVALAQDSTTPQVLIEDVFTAEERRVPGIYRGLLTGLEIPIRRSQDLAPIIYIEKLPDGRLKFTTVPIQYPNYSTMQGPGTFVLDPPPSLNVEAGLPILSNAKVVEAERHFSSYKNKTAQPQKPATGSIPGINNALMPVRPAVAADGSKPAPPVARAQAVPTPTSPAPTPEPIAPTPMPTVARALPVGATPPPAAPAEAVAAAPAVGEEVTLKPFMGGTQQGTVASTTSGKWQTYKPGQMPRGKLVGVSDARSLANSDVTTEPLYLQGDFNVTAANGSSAVLRSSGGDTAATTRVIVQYPAGSNSPAQGDRVNRGGTRPFLITNIQQKPDGQVNIYVREITTGE